MRLMGILPGVSSWKQHSEQYSKRSEGYFHAGLCSGRISLYSGGWKQEKALGRNIRLSAGAVKKRLLLSFCIQIDAVCPVDRKIGGMAVKLEEKGHLRQAQEKSKEEKIRRHISDIQAGSLDGFWLRILRENQKKFWFRLSFYLPQLLYLVERDALVN